MVSQRVKEELTIQLILLGLSILVMAAYLWIMLPRWKKEILMREAMVRVMDAKDQVSHSLSGKEELLVQEFKRMVSVWEHEQLQKSRRRIDERLQRLSERKQRGEKAPDNREKSS